MKMKAFTSLILTKKKKKSQVKFCVICICILYSQYIDIRGIIDV